MIRQIWCLAEGGDGNLGLACSDKGLFLGRTPLIEWRHDRFIVRDRGDIERLLARAYRTEIAADRLMPGLATVASALNAHDMCLACIAAVHLRLPNLPDLIARDDMEAADRLINMRATKRMELVGMPRSIPASGSRPTQVGLR